MSIFSHQFGPRWLNTPTAVKQTIINELHDIITLLHVDTDLHSFRFQVDNLSETIDYLMSNEPNMTSPQTPSSEVIPEKPKNDNLLAKQQEHEARLIKQLTEQAKLSEPLVHKQSVKPNFSPMENPFNHDIQHIKQQIIDDIKHQVNIDIKESLLSWLNDEVEKQVNEKLKNYL